MYLIELKFYCNNIFCSAMIITEIKKIQNCSKVILLMGPTASGKTDLAMLLSRILPIEIISVDSALIYRYMDIGTAKPSLQNLSEVPHRLINIKDPAECYSVVEFCQDALQAMEEIINKGKIPLLVGGAMFYFHALLSGGFPRLPSCKPEVRLYIAKKAKKIGWDMMYKKLERIDKFSADRIHPNDTQRISRALEIFFISGKTLTELNKFFLKINLLKKYQVYKFVIMPFDKIVLHKYIERRFYKMLSLGFEKEVRFLFSRGDLYQNMPSIRCVGYRQMWLYLLGKIQYNEMIFQGICATKKLAKRQITWLRKWKDVHYLNSDNIFLSCEKILKVINENR
ncbi:tRNA dimethylallyltransferase [Candidatus Westeberhardia cardiocondylae]|uniref:tRNA dimethylallyltransferase n=2 Tax=Candidatus Westeberhardia cardiocondylae TaxID=1594731 RepID=A0A0H5BX17_9ENTR|nr:tRNA dimethylallyltransferase [Candidatus Westeberhardia cardiocondylae]